MNQELFDRLREADPVLWNEYDGWRRSLFESGFLSSSEIYDTMLQHCLQAAIRARGWGYAIGRSSKGMTSASVYVPGENEETIMGYDEAEALSRAYLEAIEAVA